MEKHIGQIVEKVVRMKGVNLSELAKEINVSRSSLYNSFKRSEMHANLVFRVGQVIKHDFSNEFPELYNENESSYRSTIPTPDPDDEYETKYYELMAKFQAHLKQRSLNGNEK